MNSLTKFLLYLSDWELFKKPQSSAIRASIINDILRVDSTKWYHPKLPNGETSLHWGTIETINGKQIFKNGDLDLYTYKHPDIPYDLKHCSSWTYRDGDEENLTEKDMRLIAEAFYSRKNKRIDNFSANVRILMFRYRQFAEVILFIIGLVGAAYWLFLLSPKIVIAILILMAICFIGSYAINELIKLVKSN